MNLLTSLRFTERKKKHYYFKYFYLIFLINGTIHLQAVLSSSITLRSHSCVCSGSPFKDKSKKKTLHQHQILTHMFSKVVLCKKNGFSQFWLGLPKLSQVLVLRDGGLFFGLNRAWSVPGPDVTISTCLWRLDLFPFTPCPKAMWREKQNIFGMSKKKKKRRGNCTWMGINACKL